MMLVKRDQAILRTLSFNPCLASQLAMLFFTSCKKAAERMKTLYDEKLVRRFPQPFMEGRGKAEFVYFLSPHGRKTLEKLTGTPVSIINPLKDVYLLPHRLMTGDLHIAFAKPVANGFKAAFYYPGQLSLKTEALRLFPDALAVIEDAETGKKILHFIEADCGSEALTSKNAYSIEGKLKKYSRLFDDKDSLDTFCKALGFQFKGFRVLVVAKDKKRIEGMKRVSAGLDAEFAWYAKHEDIKAIGVFERVWENHKHERLSLLRPYPKDGEMDREMTGEQIPVQRKNNACKTGTCTKARQGC